mgnify:FL=1
MQIYKVNPGEEGTKNLFSIYGAEDEIFDKKYLFWEHAFFT